MCDVYTAFIEWLRESGYVIEDDGNPCVHIWKGPGRCKPVMYSLQFVGRLKQSSCHSGDGSDRLNVWCSYIDINDHPMKIGDTHRTFSFSDPGMVDDFLRYVKFHDSNAEPTSYRGIL